MTSGFILLLCFTVKRCEVKRLKMLLKINGQPQMSFEQFQQTFQDVFGREMTPDERRWFEPGFQKPNPQRELESDVA